MRRGTKAKKKSFFKDHGGTVIILICVFVLYEIATDMTGTLDSMFFPGFSKILPKMYASRAKLGESFISSMKLLIPGYFTALISGVILGIIIGTHPRINKNLKPIIFDADSTIHVDTIFNCNLADILSVICSGHFYWMFLADFDRNDQWNHSDRTRLFG